MSRTRELDRRGKQMIAVSALVMLVLITSAVLLKPESPCPSEYHRKTVFVVDHTEEISSQTRVELTERALTWVRDSVRVGELVTVYPVDGASTNDLKPLYSGCKLRENVSRVTGNQRAAIKRYQKDFLEPLKRALDAPVSPSDRSPLAQALIDISLSTSLRSDSSSLVVFSDMLENDRGFSAYRCVDASQVIPQFRSARVGAQERPEFRNTRVALHVIPRPGLSPAQLRCRDTLWAWFFGDSQGALAGLDVSYLPGGPTASTSGTGAR